MQRRDAGSKRLPCRHGPAVTFARATMVAGSPVALPSPLLLLLVALSDEVDEPSEEEVDVDLAFVAAGAPYPAGRRSGRVGDVAVAESVTVCPTATPSRRTSAKRVCESFCGGRQGGHEESIQTDKRKDTRTGNFKGKLRT